MKDALNKRQTNAVRGGRRQFTHLLLRRSLCLVEKLRENRLGIISSIFVRRLMSHKKMLRI